MRTSWIFVLVLINGLGLAFGEDAEVKTRPRFLSTTARTRASKSQEVTAPVARRPAGQFPFSEPEPEPEVKRELPKRLTTAPPQEVPRPEVLERLGVVNRSAASPLAPDDQGRLQGATVADRMEGILNRAVDGELSRSFVTVEGMEGTMVEAPAAAPLRPLPPPPTTPAASRPVRTATPVPTPAPSRPEAQPVPAAQPSPVRQEPYAFRIGTSPTGNDETRSKNLLFSNSAPAISLQTIGPRKVVIGKEAEYRVMISNSGDILAENVIVTAQLPAWAEVISSGASMGSPQVDATPGQNSVVAWRIDRLEAKGSQFMTLIIVPRDSRPFDLAVGWAFAPESSMAQIQVEEPKLEMVITGPDEVMYGDTEVYTITPANPGTGEAENVVLNLLPVSAQQHMAGTRNMGTLRAGERKSVDIELTAHQAGRLQIKAMAYADGGLRTESIQEVTVHRASLDVALLGPPRNFAATAAVYRIRIENNGDATADDTVVQATLPRGSQFINCTDGGKLDTQKANVMWHIGSLRPGAVRILEPQLELSQAGENRFDVQCRADRDLSVTRSLVTVVEALADLKLQVNDPKGAIAVGTDAVYEIKILNRGTKAAENVQLLGYFSEGIEPLTVRGLQGAISTGQVSLENIPSILPGQEVVIRITARALQPGDHVFRAELTCASPETRLASEEWTKYFQSVPDQMPEQVARQPELRGNTVPAQPFRLEPLR